MRYWDGLLHIQALLLSKILHPTIYKDDTGELFLELTPDNMPIIHCYIYKWTKSSYKHQKLVWESVITALKNKGYETIYAAAKDEKLIKFAKMFGFEPTETYIIDTEQDTRRLLKC